MIQKIYSNGKQISDQRTIDLLRDEAVGVFETMRVYHGKIFLEEEHLQRLIESARAVGYKPIPNSKKMREELALTLQQTGDEAKDTSVRLTLWEGRIFVFIGARVIPSELYRTGAVLKTASFPRGNANAFPYQSKASAYQQAILASTEPSASGVFDWVFVDMREGLTETRTGNFFIVKDRILLTPPEHLILNGVTRRFVIKCAHELKLKVRETPLMRHDFFNADEAFLSNTSWEILPVRELDGRAIGIKIPGPVTTELHRLFKRRIRESCPSK